MLANSIKSIIQLLSVFSFLIFYRSCIFSYIFLFVHVKSKYDSLSNRGIKFAKEGIISTSQSTSKIRNGCFHVFCLIFVSLFSPPPFISLRFSFQLCFCVFPSRFLFGCMCYGLSSLSMLFLSFIL